MKRLTILAFGLLVFPALAAPEPPNPLTTIAPLVTSPPIRTNATPAPSATLPPNVAQPDEVQIGSSKLVGCVNVIFTTGNYVQMECARDVMNLPAVKGLRTAQQGALSHNSGTPIAMSIRYRNGKEKPLTEITLLDIGFVLSAAVNGSNPPAVRLKLYYAGSR